MNDGTQQSVSLTTTTPLDSQIIEATTEPRLNGVGPMQTPQDKFYTAARNIAKDQAKSIFSGTRNPYREKPNMPEVKALARSLYYAYGLDQLQFAQSLSLHEAQENFTSEFKETYPKMLSQLSIEYDAPTEETQQLLVAARTDQENDRGDLPWNAQERAIVRAFISLSSDKIPHQEDVNEKLLSELPERIGLYQKFYDEFEPAKEED